MRYELVSRVAGEGGEEGARAKRLSLNDAQEQNRPCRITNDATISAAAGEATWLKNLKPLESGLSTAVKSARWVGRMNCRWTDSQDLDEQKKSCEFYGEAANGGAK